MGITADILGMNLADSIRAAIAAHNKHEIERVYIRAIFDKNDNRARAFVRVALCPECSCDESLVNDYALSLSLADLLWSRRLDGGPDWWVYSPNHDINCLDELYEDNDMLVDALVLRCRASQI